MKFLIAQLWLPTFVNFYRVPNFMFPNHFCLAFTSQFFSSCMAHGQGEINSTEGSEKRHFSNMAIYIIHKDQMRKMLKVYIDFRIICWPLCVLHTKNKKLSSKKPDHSKTGLKIDVLTHTNF